jgi:hypothetical protein
MPSREVALCVLRHPELRIREHMAANPESALGETVVVPPAAFAFAVTEVEYSSVVSNRDGCHLLVIERQTVLEAASLRFALEFFDSLTERCFNLS